MLIRTSAAAALMLAFALVACGSDDGDDGGGSGTGAAAKTSCNAYCEATASCPDYFFTDVEECKANECGGLEQATGDCGTAFKNHYDCVNAKTDKCDEVGCELDFNACM